MSFSRLYLVAVLWVLLSTGLFSVVFAAAKVSARFSEVPLGTFQILFLRYGFAFVALLAVAALTGGIRRYRSPRPLRHLARAAFGCGAAAAVTWASARMPIADATALSMLYGVLAVLMGVALLGERLRPGQLAAVLLSVTGAAVVMRGQGAFGGGLPVWPVGVAVLGAGLMAAEGVLIRLLSLAEPALTLMLYTSCFGALLMAGPALATWQGPGVAGLMFCAGLGAVSVLAQYCTIRGYRLAPLSVVGPVDYSWLIFAGLLGALVFGEALTRSLWIGGALICAGGVLLIWVRPPA